MTTTTASTTASTTDAAGLPKATVRETLGVLLGVAAPTVAKGVIIRRPRMVSLVERFDLDRRAVRRVRRLRDRYGDGPLMLRLPIRRQALLLSPDHVRRVLEESPEPFATASSEKRAALSHFQPKGVLISHGRERADRRRYNEAVLDAPCPVHRLGERFGQVVAEEAAPLLAEARRRGALDWDAFAGAWFRVVRRVVLGDAARDDEELTDLLNQLRADANWAFARRKRTDVRDRLSARLGGHLARAEPGSLAATMAATPAMAETAPEQQPPQWLFAFDPAGMATFRALALLAAHPEQAARADAEIRGRGEAGGLDLPFLRACVLESLRLWPTTPMILRQTTAATTWDAAVMPTGTGVAIYAPFFHRDDARRADADRFAPDQWLDGRAADDWSLVPFSGGPAACPGRNLVLLTTGAMLAALLDGARFRLDPPGRLDPRRPLPGTLNHFSLRFRVGE